MTDPTLTPEGYGPDCPDGLAMAAADAARDKAERDQLSIARSRLAMAADNLHLAYFIPGDCHLWHGQAIRNLQTACAALGYDLVKRDD